MRAGSRAVGWCAVLALIARGAGADVFVVDTNLDGAAGLCPANPTTLATAVGTCSLRSAIAAANATAVPDLILFAPAVFAAAASKIIAIASPLPDLTGPVEINATSGSLLPQRVQGIVIRAGGSVTDLFAVLSVNAQLNDVLLEGGDLSLQGSARLIFDQSVDASFAEAITGTGSLLKQGTAKLVLGGVNDYGDTRIDAGTLQGNTQSIPGPGRLVQDAGLLVFDQDTSDPEDFFGAISGTGRVQKLGAGSLYLRTANTYTGGTAVTAGTLEGFAGSTSATGSLQGDIVDDATLVFDQTVDGSFAGAITGAGSVRKIGPGTLTLTGANRYTGGTTLSIGKLQGDADAIPANVAIASGTELVFDQLGAGLHGGGISGAGAVVKQGSGTLTLGGSNSYTGSTRVLAGTLAGDTQSLQGDIDVQTGSTLAFDQSFMGSFTGLLGGAGALEKRGSGTLRLTADLTAGGGFLGPTTVRGGRLELGAPASARLPGDVSILSGAALGGVGSLGGTATASSGGAISPGNSVGTLSVGSASFQAGSFLELDVTPTSADELVVTGAATLDPGAKLRILPAPGAYPAMGTGSYLPVLVAGSKTGLFDVPADFAFLDVAVDQTGNQVLLKIESNGNTLTSLATSANQREVAQALETAQAGGDPDLNAVFAELNPLLASDVPTALDAMSGQQLTEFATARLAIAERFHTSIQERIRGVPDRASEALFADAGGRGAPALAASPVLFSPLSEGMLGSSSAANLAAALAMQDGGLPLASPSADGGLGGWVDGYGSFGNVSGTSGTNDFDTTIWGVSAGVDTRIAERWTAGLAGGYAHSTLDFDGLSGQPEADTAQGAAYAGYVSPLFEAGADFRFAWNGMTGRRDIAFPSPSTFARSADSSFDGIDLGGHVEGALNLYEVSGISFQPLAAFTYTHLQQDSFQETGAGSLSIDAAEQQLDSIVSGVGLRVHGRFQLGEDLWLRPELRARWLHEFGDTERTLDARIGGVPGATYTVRGATVSRDSGSLGVSWTVVRAGRLHVFAEYDVAVNPELLQHSAAVGVRILW